MKKFCLVTLVTNQIRLSQFGFCLLICLSACEMHDPTDIELDTESTTNAIGYKMTSDYVQYGNCLGDDPIAHSNYPAPSCTIGYQPESGPLKNTESGSGICTNSIHENYGHNELWINLFTDSYEHWNGPEDFCYAAQCYDLAWLTAVVGHSVNRYDDGEDGMYIAYRDVNASLRGYEPGVTSGDLAWSRRMLLCSSYDNNSANTHPPTYFNSQAIFGEFSFKALPEPGELSIALGGIYKLKRPGVIPVYFAMPWNSMFWYSQGPDMRINYLSMRFEHHCQDERNHDGIPGDDYVAHYATSSSDYYNGNVIDPMNNGILTSTDLTSLAAFYLNPRLFFGFSERRFAHSVAKYIELPGEQLSQIPPNASLGPQLAHLNKGPNTAATEFDGSDRFEIIEKFDRQGYNDFLVKFDCKWASGQETEGWLSMEYESDLSNIYTGSYFTGEMVDYDIRIYGYNKITHASRPW